MFSTELLSGMNASATASDLTPVRPDPVSMIMVQLPPIVIFSLFPSQTSSSSPWIGVLVHSRAYLLICSLGTNKNVSKRFISKVHGNEVVPISGMNRPHDNCG